jgi:hypothetical protein
MSVKVSRACSFGLAVAVAAACSVAGLTASTEAPKRPGPTTAGLFAGVHEHLARMAGSERPAADDVAALTQALIAGKSRPMTDAHIATVASTVATAIARGAFDEESVERLAQNLFAVVNNGTLTGREASLLVLDVSMLLTDAGTDRAAVDSVIAALSDVCPAGTERVEAPAVSRRPRPSLLTRDGPSL